MKTGKLVVGVCMAATLGLVAIPAFSEPRIVYNDAVEGAATGPRIVYGGESAVAPDPSSRIIYNRAVTGYGLPNRDTPNKNRVVTDAASSRAAPHGVAADGGVPWVVQGDVSEEAVLQDLMDAQVPVGGNGAGVGAPVSSGHTTETFRSKSTYYPGYLSYYPYGHGSFAYDAWVPERAAPPPEVHVLPPPPSQAREVPDRLPVSSVAAFAPNQAVLSRVMLSGFSVHIGSFLDYADAKGLEERLRTQGLPVFYTPVLFNGVSYVQLHVGPFQDREWAESMDEIMREKMNIHGVLLFYGL